MPSTAIYLSPKFTSLMHLHFMWVYNYRRIFTYTAHLFFKDVWLNNEKTLKSLFIVICHTVLYRDEGLNRKELWLRLRKLQFPPYYRPSALVPISKAFCCHNWGLCKLVSTYIHSWVTGWSGGSHLDRQHQVKAVPRDRGLLETKSEKRERQGKRGSKVRKDLPFTKAVM